MYCLGTIEKWIVHGKEAIIDEKNKKNLPVIYRQVFYIVDKLLVIMD